MHLQKVIEKLGYKQNESKVYLAALHLGESTVAEIARIVKLPRTSVQVIIENLHKAGMINFFLKKGQKQWVAENPEKFLIDLKEKEAGIRAAMPELLAARSNVGARPTVKVFNGLEEIKMIMEDIIATKHNILAIHSWADWMKFMGREFMEDFIERRTAHFLKIRLITPPTPEALELKNRDQKELRATKCMPEHVRIDNANFIYGNKVAIITLNEKRPTGILIEDADIYHTMSILFESLWMQCK